MILSREKLGLRLIVVAACFAAGWMVLSLVGIQHWNVTGGDVSALIGLIGGTIAAHLMTGKKNG
ncbi:hypothetical protein [Sphingomonas fuzhouensis]|uniref:hypothetical protein n=1 Tax=Sphingomonas fuzhouensis TaxID=3106033 RepID=UPI002AFF66D8|nr:hypothetical protein [Sphingomonas sp. SGZ-02]